MLLNIPVPNHQTGNLKGAQGSWNGKVQVVENFK